MEKVSDSVLDQCAINSQTQHEVTQLRDRQAEITANKWTAQITIDGHYFTVARHPRKKGFQFYKYTGDSFGLDAANLKKLCYKVVHAKKNEHKVPKKAKLSGIKHHDTKSSGKA